MGLNTWNCNGNIYYVTKRVAILALITALLVLLSVYKLTETKWAGVDLPSFYRKLSANFRNSNDFVNKTYLQWKAMKQHKVEKHHVVFLKVQKTGSSSVQNMFLRFGYSRNLTFVLGHDNNLTETRNLPNMISFVNTLNDRNIVPPPSGRHYDILCCHVIYNHLQFEKYMPKDSVYIGIVREPISRLESAFEFFKLFKNVDMGDYAANPLKYDKAFPSLSNNRMAFEYGFPRNLLPGSKNKPVNFTQEISAYVEFLRSKFSLILVNERLEESLVMMKRVLSWHTKDILFENKLVRNKTRSFSKKHATSLKSFLYLDYAVYNAALQDFQTKVNSLGEGFIKEVQHFKEIRATVLTFCNTKGVSSKLFEASEWESAFSINRSECELLQKAEIPFIQMIRKKQYGHLGI